MSFSRISCVALILLAALCAGAGCLHLAPQPPPAAWGLGLTRPAPAGAGAVGPAAAAAAVLLAAAWVGWRWLRPRGAAARPPDREDLALLRTAKDALAMLISRRVGRWLGRR
jgi:hypothetical protein